MELLIRGPKAYGYLQSEKGSHRLVRISPFIVKRPLRRSMTPELPPSILNTLDDIIVPDTELEVTTIRLPGKGGQHVNKFSSGGRMKHLPSGITVRCTEERSQLANRNIAIQHLNHSGIVMNGTCAIVFHLNFDELLKLLPKDLQENIHLKDLPN